MNFGTEFSSQANKLNQDVVEITDDFTFLKGKHTFTVGTHNEFYQFYNLFIQGLLRQLPLLEHRELPGRHRAVLHAQLLEHVGSERSGASFSVRQFGVLRGRSWRAEVDNFTLTYGLRVDLPRFPDTPLANPLAVTDFGLRHRRRAVADDRGRRASASTGT